jgi:ferritin-like metal-binding protein YciE
VAGTHDSVDTRALFVHQLSELLTIEETLARELLPILRGQVTEKHFREAIDEHIAQTREHVTNLELVFEKIRARPEEVPSHGLAGLQRQHEASVLDIADSTLRDLFNASSAAHTEHLEISAYHSVITLANILGEPEAVRLLERNLHDEEEALEKVEKSIPERLTGELAPT